MVIIEDDYRIVRFGDIGTAELDTENRKNILRRNGIPMVSCVIIPQPGANQIVICQRGCIENMIRCARTCLKILSSMSLSIIHGFIRASISKCKQRGFGCFCAGGAGIFLFLRNTRVTLIPTLVIPISLNRDILYHGIWRDFPSTCFPCLRWCFPWDWWWTMPSWLVKHLCEK